MARKSKKEEQNIFETFVKDYLIFERLAITNKIFEKEPPQNMVTNIAKDIKENERHLDFIKKKITILFEKSTKNETITEKYNELQEIIKDLK